MVEAFSRARLEAMRIHGWTPSDVRALIAAHDELMGEAEERPTAIPGETLRLACDLCPACWQRLERSVAGGGRDV